MAEPRDPADLSDRRAGTHAARGSGRPRRTAMWAGSAAIVIAAAVGLPMALRPSPDPLDSSPASMQHITADPARVPLTDAELGALLRQPPALGALTDPRRRAACVSALGYPAGTAVAGGTPIQIAGRPAVLLLFAEDAPDTFIAIAVAPTCNAADTGRLAATTFTHHA